MPKQFFFRSIIRPIWRYSRFWHAVIRIKNYPDKLSKNQNYSGNSKQILLSHRWICWTFGFFNSEWKCGLPIPSCKQFWQIFPSSIQKIEEFGLKNQQYTSGMLWSKDFEKCFNFNFQSGLKKWQKNMKK